MAAKRSAAAATPTLPTKARIVYRGKIQSQAFVAGATALAEILDRADHELRHEVPWSRQTELIEDALRGEFAREGEHRDGMIAALADFLNECLQTGARDFESWQPLSFVPSGGPDGREEPEIESLFFEVAGVPVSVAPDLTTHKWNKNGADYFSTDITRTIGKPISRRKFDAMRRAAEASNANRP